MKALVLLGKPTSTDITIDDMLGQWKALENIPGLEYIIKRYEKFPTIEEFNALIDEDCDAVLGVWITKDFLSEAFFESHPRLKYLAGLAHGYEEIDFEMTRGYGVTITNTAYGSSTVAEYVFALLMDICHNIERQNRYVKEHKWWEPGAPQYMYATEKQLELCNMTMGIIGLGKIGYCTAKIANGFGMKVVAYDKYPKSGSEYDFIEQVSLDELYSVSDVISIHSPLTKESYGMINKDSILKMKDGVIFINTARGSLVNEPDLVEALNSGKIYAAGLDVISEEPPKSDLPILRCSNAKITSHIAWLPKSSRLRQVSLAIDNYKSYLNGNPVSVINDIK
jgi:glycerate dehydrogenase